ncbi:MAG: c-type cytochrome [Candidatus Tectomicrobia bacterium]|nr:c-type cytochrome [Candidatus Tectomicrobia bacterium]
MRAAVFLLLLSGMGAWSVPPWAAQANPPAPSGGGELPPPPPLGLDDIPVPPDNPMTREKVELGRLLFFEKRISADGTAACATCHMPARGFSNARQYGVGVEGKLGIRNVPTVLNAAYYSSQFWDGRAKSLEEQAKGPILNPAEMASSEERVVKILGAIPAYGEAFRRAFGDPAISLDRAAKAIATFERTLVSGGSPFDRWKFGGEEAAISADAKRGFDLFKSKAQCVKCHLVDEFSAPLTDNKFHNIGIGMDKQKPELGRAEITKDRKDRGKFKTPSLREVTRTAPYMHDGRFNTLEEVLDFYDKGGHPNPSLDPDIFPLKLTQKEKKDLLAFLRTLEGNAPRVAEPEAPR